MDISNLNEKQKQALKINNESNIAWFDHATTIIDESTGEILKQKEETIRRTSGEPDFIKLYYKTMLAFNDVQDIPLNFILGISNHISWTNDSKPMHFSNTKIVREEICESCKIKEAMYRRYIARCKEYGLLLPVKGYRGLYEVNPFFIAKGKWDSIKKLRTNFNFINGVWQRIIETDINANAVDADDEVN